MVDITLKSYEVKGIRLNVAESGKGEPLVLIHGWSNNWQGWTLLAEQLSPQYHLLMVDLPGFGDSGPSPDYSIEFLADLLADFIARFHPKTRAIIGGSMGTLIASELVKRHPKSCKQLILLGAFFERPSIGFIAKLYKNFIYSVQDSQFWQNAFQYWVGTRLFAYGIEYFLNAYRFNKKLVDLYSLPGKRKINGKAYLELGAQLKNYQLSGTLSQIKLPIFLIFGTHDRYVCPEYAKRVVQELNLPQLAISFISECGHNPAYEQPEKSAELIRIFLKSYEQPKGRELLARISGIVSRLPGLGSLFDRFKHRISDG